MRFAAAALVATLMLAGTAWAQRHPAHIIPSVPPPRDPPPRFTIAPRGAPLAPIGLPLPRLGLQPLANPGDYHRPPRGRRFYYWAPPVFYVPQPVMTTVPVFEAPAQPAERPPAPGRLILEVNPAEAEIFADGYYIGVPADFSAAREGGMLEPGLHRIDVSASGYEPSTVHMRVVSGQTVTYRAALKELPPPVVVPPSTFYLIPGCYLGNIPPKDARLPATCDPSRAVTWRP